MSDIAAFDADQIRGLLRRMNATGGDQSLNDPVREEQAQHLAAETDLTIVEARQCVNIWYAMLPALRKMAERFQDLKKRFEDLARAIA
jgi:hypothetical protein